jgi:hypothetical protein
VPKGARRAGGLDEMIISLYAGGMTARDIRHHRARTIATDLLEDEEFGLVIDRRGARFVSSTAPSWTPGEPPASRLWSSRRAPSAWSGWRE